MYPWELETNLEYSGRHATFLDLDIKIEDGTFPYIYVYIYRYIYIYIYIYLFIYIYHIYIYIYNHNLSQWLFTIYFTVLSTLKIYEQII